MTGAFSDFQQQAIQEQRILRAEVEARQGVARRTQDTINEYHQMIARASAFITGQLFEKNVRPDIEIGYETQPQYLLGRLKVADSTSVSTGAGWYMGAYGPTYTGDVNNAGVYKFPWVSASLLRTNGSVHLFRFSYDDRPGGEPQPPTMVTEESLEMPNDIQNRGKITTVIQSLGLLAHKNGIDVSSL